LLADFGLDFRLDFRLRPKSSLDISLKSKVLAKLDLTHCHWTAQV